MFVHHIAILRLRLLFLTLVFLKDDPYRYYNDAPVPPLILPPSQLIKQRELTRAVC